MSNFSYKILVYFVAIVLLQVLLFNQITLFTYYIPFVYILFLIVLPFDVNKLLLITSAFVLGTIQDVFSGTIGIHSFATVFVAFLRPAILTAYTPLSGYDKNIFLETTTYGFGWFVKYSFSIVLIHAFILYLTDYFSFSAIGYVMLKTIISSVITEVFLLATLFGIFERFK